MTCRSRWVRVDFDTSDDRFGKKIRNATQGRAPFILIAGGEDRDGGTVSFRFRDGSQRNGVSIEEAVRTVVDYIASRSNESPTAGQ